MFTETFGEIYNYATEQKNGLKSANEKLDKLLQLANDQSEPVELPDTIDGVLLAVPIAEFVTLEPQDAHNAITANINNGIDVYPSAFFVNGESELDVHLHESLRVYSVKVKVHLPDDRIYNLKLDAAGYKLSIVGDTYTFKAENIDGILPLSAITLELNGNDRNAWTGIYSIQVFSYDEQTYKPKPLDPLIFDVNNWPLEAGKVNFRSTYNSLEGYELMKLGPAYVDNFRFDYGDSGRAVSVKNQNEFDEARNNGDIGVIRFLSSHPVVLFDKPRNHNSIQLLIVDTLSHIRTWGKLVVDCQKVSAPQGASHSIICHGGDVLKSLPRGLPVTNNDWGDILIQPCSDEPIGNIVSQGGVDFNEYVAGRETVEFSHGAWQSDWQDHWKAGVQRPFDMRTFNCGIQGKMQVNVGADGRQTTLMPSYIDPAKPNHPHGDVHNLDVFAIGVICGITEDQILKGHGEQMSDDKAALGLTVAHCATWNFTQNRIWQNGSNGTGLAATHFLVNKTKVYGCLTNSQRGVEFGCGADNVVEECFFIDPTPLNDKAIELGLKPAGALGIVSYVEDRYLWLDRAFRDTRVNAVNNVFDHAPTHVQNAGSRITSTGQTLVDKNLNVLGNFGPFGAQVIGTTDKKAKGTMWYAA